MSIVLCWYNKCLSPMKKIIHTGARTLDILKSLGHTGARTLDIRKKLVIQGLEPWIFAKSWPYRGSNPGHSRY